MAARRAFAALILAGMAYPAIIPRSSVRPFSSEFGSATLKLNYGKIGEVTYPTIEIEGMKIGGRKIRKR